EAAVSRLMGTMENPIVADLLGGRVTKGASFDVFPDRLICHVATRDQGVVIVKLADLKALFFVKDLQGSADHHDEQTFAPGDPRVRGARLLEIRFRDGERLVGLAPAYSEAPPFFFVVPADATSNNLRILVNRAASESVT